MFFEIFLSVLEDSEELQRDVDQNRQSCKDGFGANKFENSAAKKTFILAIVEGIQ